MATKQIKFGTDVDFAKRFTAKLKNVEIEFIPDAQRIGKIMMGARKVSAKAYDKYVKAAVAQTRWLVSDFIHDRFVRSIKGNNPITKELLKVIDKICLDLATDKRYIKFYSDEAFSIRIEMTLFSLEIFDYRTRPLRSMYYRRGGPILKDKNKKSKAKRRKDGSIVQMPQVYIQQSYRQKQGSYDRFPGMGWLVEFGRVNTGWINPRDNNSQDITPYALPRIEGERNGKAKYSRTHTRRMLLIWDKARGGYIFRPRAKYGTAVGKHSIYRRDKVISTAVTKYAIKTLQEQLEKQTGGKGLWSVVS